MEFEDRVSTHPNRYKMTDENDNVSMVYLERADEPVVPGTPLNAETFNSLYLYSEDLAYPGCYCRDVDGETEWMNPPMVPGHVYRTSKRFNGYPVYAAVFRADRLADSGEAVSITLKDISRVVSVSTTYYKKGSSDADSVCCDPMVDDGGVCVFTETVLKNTIRIKSVREGIDYENWYAICVIEATKEGE